MKELYYHSTALFNLKGINNSGIKPSPDGFVHLCKDPLDAFEFGLEKYMFEENELFVVIPVLLDSEKLQSYQEDSIISGVPIDCVKHKGAISKKCISHQDDVFLYSTKTDISKQPEHIGSICKRVVEIIKSK